MRSVNQTKPLLSSDLHVSKAGAGKPGTSSNEGGRTAGAASTPEAQSPTRSWPTDTVELASPALQQAQARLDEIAQSIHAAADSRSGPGRIESGVPIVGGVFTSRNPAGILVTATNGNINLGGAGASDGASRSWDIRVSGVLGGQQLSFASGTTLSNIVQAINSYADGTGVTATLDHDRIGLKSTQPGPTSFVSLSVNELDDVTNISIDPYGAAGSPAEPPEAGPARS